MKENDPLLPSEDSLDPADWQEYRLLAHRMVDNMIDVLQGIRDRPVWKKPPETTKTFLNQDLPDEGIGLTATYEEFTNHILPYFKGNIHPRFFSWVEGNGTFSGALADFLGSVMNSNLGIGDHGAIYVEHQVLNWCKKIVGFPCESAGVLASGGSVANLTALTVARNAFRDGLVKKNGLRELEAQLVLYCSTETHNCIFKAAETLGIGSDYLRKIPVDEGFRIDLTILRTQIREDRKKGLLPFCVVANAGTVNTGAIDPLNELLALCREESLWFHVDGAIGAVLNMLPEYAEPFRGMAMADSIAFDLHKWLYVNYEAGCVLIRDAENNRRAFTQQANYLSPHERGLAAGPESFSNYGFELSRGFKSLKVWMSIREHGIKKYQQLIRQNIAQARYLGARILQSPGLELLTPVTLNIVCFRYNPGNLEKDALNNLNKELLMQLQEKGIAAPSYTFIRNQYAIRMNITNHRTRNEDLEAVLENTLALGKTIHAQSARQNHFHSSAKAPGETK
jgi:aromatic-L-amino-acid/L-tryptophan decarboxylase